MIYPLSLYSIRWLHNTFSRPALQEPGGTVVRKISGVPCSITRPILFAAARLKGLDVKVHGSLYLISKPDIKAATLVGTAVQYEAALLPYLMGKSGLYNG